MILQGQNKDIKGRWDEEEGDRREREDSRDRDRLTLKKTQYRCPI